MPRLRHIANRAVDKHHPYRSIMDLQLDMHKRSSVTTYLLLALFIAVIMVLVYLLIK
ncbi:MAG: hypothetical protein K2K29_04175 [Muribaculaceae bacterium]|nr:hypothetical protein [Muribaculaceae bacterium]